MSRYIIEVVARCNKRYISYLSYGSMKIRQATVGDLQAITKLNEELFKVDSEWDRTLDFSWPTSTRGQEYFATRLVNEGGVAFVAEIDGEIVGYLCGSIEDALSYRSFERLADLGDMFVLLQYRNAGIGSALVKSFKLWSKEQGVKRIRVEVTAQNSKALSFYSENGFEHYNVVMEQEI